MRVKPRLVFVAVAGIAMAATPLLASPAAGAAGAPAGFSATAEADGLRVTVVANGGPLTSVPVDIGSPVAQATLDSLGSSQAFASQAYPGDEAITLPGTVAGVTKGAANVPHYPLIAESDASTQPSAHVDTGGSSLNAASSSSQSKASAVTGAQSADNHAGLTSGRAEVSQADDGIVTATGTNDAEAVTIGPLILGRVHSSATVRLPPGATPSKSSSLEVTGASVAGVAIGISPAGLTAASSNAPLPSTSSVNDVLRNAGISLAYVAPEVTPTGIISAGLKVTTSQAVPGPVTPVGITYVFGQSAATVDGAASTNPRTAASPASVDTAFGQTTSPDAPAAANGGSAPDLGMAGSPSTPAVLPARSAPGAERPALALRPLAPHAAGNRGAIAGFDISAFYLVIAAGAIAAAVMSRLVSLLGVKQWIS